MTWKRLRTLVKIHTMLILLACTSCALRRVAQLAEQQLRKSAEGRLGAELRKAIRLAAYNQEVTTANNKLQQQLREAKAEVRTALRFTLSHSIGSVLWCQNSLIDSLYCHRQRGCVQTTPALGPRSRCAVCHPLEWARTKSDLAGWKRAYPAQPHTPQNDIASAHAEAAAELMAAPAASCQDTRPAGSAICTSV